MINHILLSIPEISGNEWKYVKECFDTNWVSSAGKYVDKFEENIKKLTGSKFAIACINGTAALHISLILSDVGQNDEVIVPTLTFISPINVVKYVGAYPVFMDCDEKFFNLDVNKLEKFIKNECNFDGNFLINKKTNRKIKAIIPIHIFGNPCEMDKLLEIGKKYNLKIIEDATESLGSKYKNKYTGTIGDFGCYSFNGNKIITTGGGGILVTNDEKLGEKAKYLTTQAKDDTIYYIHNEIGYNYRMTNITAAFGVAQLERLEEFIEIKRKNAKLYENLLKNIDGIEFATFEPENCFSNHWFYTIFVDKEKGTNRDELLKKLNDNKIQTRPIWKLNHTQKPYENCLAYEIENAYKIYEKGLNIPCSVNLTEKEIYKIVEVLKN
jgi:perosamine synthetase